MILSLLLLPISVFAGVCDLQTGFPIVAEEMSSRRLPVTISDRVKGSLEYDSTTRARILCDMREALVNKYSLIELKKERISVDVAKLFEGCAEAELKIIDGDPLAFTDRVRKCVASVRDSHLSLDTQGGVANVFTGLLIKEVAGKFVISSTYPKLISYVEATSRLEDLQKHLSVGNEVLEVDGQSPETWVKKLIPYIDGSTEEFRRMMASIHILSRNFMYPDRAHVRLKVKSGEETIEVILPWWVQTTSERPDVAFYLDEIGIRPVEDVTWVYRDNPVLKSWESQELQREGWSYGHPILPKSEREGLRVFTAEGQPALRVGIHTAELGKTFCYMQLLTFLPGKLTDPKGQEREFLEPIREFVGMCKSKKLPLVFDLRLNGGGRGSYPAEVMKALMPQGEKYATPLTAFRKSSHASWLITRLWKYETPGKYIHELSDWDHLLEALEMAESDPLAKHTPILSDQPLEADSEVGGYAEKIVVLVTPYCVSACDMMTNLLHTNHRATLIGSPSNGTGAGYVSLDGLDSNWSDSYDMFSLRIPNFLFGVGEKVGPDVFLDFETHKGLLTENQPTPTDVEYRTSQEDITGDGRGWYGATLKALFP